MCRASLLLALLASACSRPDPTLGRQEKAVVVPVTAPAVARTKAKEAVGRVVLDEDWRPPSPGTGHPIYRVTWLVGDERRDAGKGWSAQVVGDALFVVETDGKLTLRRAGAAPATVDRGVAPDIVPVDGGLAYVSAGPDGEELRRVDGDGRWRTLHARLAHVDRLATLGDWLVFVGSEPGGFPGLYALGREARSKGAPAVRLTNAGMRVGQGLPPGFVSPPVHAGDLRLDGEQAVYCDGEQGWRVPLAGGETRPEPRACEGRR